MKRAVGQTNATSRRIESRFASMNRRLETGFVAMGRGMAAAFAGAIALRGAQQIIDASTRVENSLKIVGLTGDDLTRVYDRLFASAQRNGTGIEGLAELYGRAALAQKELNASSEELLGFADNVAIALRVAGKSAAESRGALIQLSQAIGAGIVRAEEFNAILEGALPIAQAAAAGLEEAGGSVAKLRTLIIDGKVSSEAFFRAFEAGSVILREKVANAELTISQGFVRLQNVLIDTAGKFDEATGASAAAAEGLNSLALVVEQLGTFMANNQGAIASFIGVLEGDYLDAIRQFRQDIGLADVVDPLLNAAAGVSQSAADIEASIHGVITAASGVADTEAIDGLIDKLAAGDLTAQELQQALIDLGGTSINFAVIHDLSGLIGQLRTARAEAQALAAIDVSGTSMTFAGQDRYPPQPETSAPAVSPVSIEDYPVGGSAGSGGGSSGGTSPLQRFEEALQQQQRETEMLREKTAVLSGLSPLVNDYGLAVERLRVQQELENAATEAGLELTPERVEAIRQLADGYAQASVEAARLAEAQDMMETAIADFGDAGKSALRGFIEDLRNGKSAADALSNALNAVLSKVLDIGLNLVFGGLGGLFGGSGGILGAIFAQGGYTGNGGKYQPAGIVHAGEYVFSKEAVQRAGVSNLEAMHRNLRGYANGGLVMPAMPASMGMRGSQPIRIALEVQEGAAFETRVLEVSGPASAEITSRSIRSYDRNLSANMSNHDARYR